MARASAAPAAAWLLAAAVLAALAAGGVEGRYLPPRGGDSRLQEIKDLLVEVGAVLRYDFCIRRVKVCYSLPHRLLLENFY